MTTAARAHLTTLVAFFVLLKAVAYFLDRRALLLEYNGRHRAVGAGYTDINAVLPAKEILAYISIVVAIAILVFSNACMRNLVWPGVVAGPARHLGGRDRRHLPAGRCSTFTVNPSLRDKEAPYIERTIEATRAAYGLDNVDDTPYPAKHVSRRSRWPPTRPIVPNIRLLDPAVVTETSRSTSRSAAFYDFARQARHRPVHGRRQDCRTSWSASARSTTRS